jgi:hypothetical protein
VFERPQARLSLAKGGFDELLAFEFTDQPCAAVHLCFDHTPSSGNLRGRLTLHNPSDQPLELLAQLLLRRPKRNEIRQEEVVRLSAGRSHEVFMKVEALAAMQFDLSAAVRDQAGRVIYSRYGRYARGRGGWQSLPKPLLPVDFRFAYWPYMNRMRVLADVRGLPPEARLESMDIRIAAAGDGPAVKHIRLEAHDFQQGRCEREFDLPPLEGKYEIVARARGQNVPAEPRVKQFERTVFEWEHNELGASRTVYPPFTPIQLEGRTARTVLKAYRLGDLSLPESIVTEQSEGLDAQELLAGPMGYRAVVSGREVVASQARFQVQAAADDQVVCRSQFALGELHAESVNTLEYDGMLRVDLTLQPVGATKVGRLDLDIPLCGRIATMVHATNGRFRDAVEFKKLPAGQGSVWSSADIPPTGWEQNFCGYVFLGNASRGLCWFTENSRGWSRKTENPSLEVVRRGDDVVLQVHFIDHEITLESPRTITFGLLAAPVKPRLPGWRHRWYSDNFSVLGCDCHWLSLGNYGSFYPAGRDLSLWKAIRRGNTQRLSDREIQQVIEDGRKNFARYGPQRVRLFESMANMNLRNRCGRQMIFYYNRDAQIGSQEFQTFMDEWCTHDYCDELRGVDSDAAVGVLPTRSFMDHALYWYAKSFEIAGNTGVYLDNLYFRPFTNTKFAGSYVREDGTVVPSNGIWEMREQAKRTFAFLCECGMEPIHMAHMTSLELLPILSFYTVQYDWEWQRGRGDVHDRFTREYLQLVSLGELSGCWPIVLHELGQHEENMLLRYDYPQLKQVLERLRGQCNDPWVLKTFLGVTMVHELLVDPYFWHYEPIPEGDTVENRLFETFRRPVLDLLQKGDVDVFRYWDPRPQPVVAQGADWPSIVYSRKGEEAIVAVTSYADCDLSAGLRIQPDALGLGDKFRVVDVETGAALAVENNVLPLRLKKHDLKVLRLSRS